MTDFFDDPPLHDFPDRAIRLLQSHPAHLEQLVAELAPAVAPLLDFSHCHSLERELPLPDWRRREADLLFEVPFRDPGEAEAAFVCLLIEHSSAPDRRLPLRTLIHAVLYWERQWQRWEQGQAEGEPLRLNPVLPLVLYTGAGRWQTATSLAELVAGPPELARLVPSWTPILLDLSQRTAEELLASDSEWLASLAVVRAEEAEPEEFRRVFAAVTRRLASLAGRDAVRWHNLLWFLVSWAYRRRPGQEQAEVRAAGLGAIEDVRVQQEYERMSQQMGISWEQELLQRGKTLGRDEGMKEGKKEGALETGRRMLLRVLNRRCGPVPAEVEERVRHIDSVERLEALIDVATEVNRLEDLSWDAPAT